MLVVAGKIDRVYSVAVIRDRAAIRTGRWPVMTDIERIEIPLLLEGVYQRYGYDFRDYACASIRRRVGSAVVAEGVESVSALQARVLHDAAAMERFLLALTVHVTAMFRDPSFYIAFREKVVPQLRTYPFVRIWHAGCSTGEEVYSLAILLAEEEIHDRCRIYATDMSETVLRGAKTGIFPLASMKEYTQNYIDAGGQRSFSEYYTAQYDSAIMRPALRENIVFAAHNLATDASPNEFNVILCRNVMIYFAKPLQEKVHRLFHESLARLGVLALGAKESLQFTPHEASYEALDERERIFRKVG